MLASAVHDYVVDLHKQWPAEAIAQLLNRPPGANKPEPALWPAQLYARQTGISAPPKLPEEPVTLAAFWFTMLLVALGIVLAAAAFFSALVWPLIDC
jgi:hypothetical protein